MYTHLRQMLETTFSRFGFSQKEGVLLNKNVKNKIFPTAEIVPVTYIYSFFCARKKVVSTSEIYYRPFDLSQIICYSIVGFSFNLPRGNYYRSSLTRFLVIY